MKSSKSRNLSKHYLIYVLQFLTLPYVSNQNPILQDQKAIISRNVASILFGNGSETQFDSELLPQFVHRNNSLMTRVMNDADDEINTKIFNDSSNLQDQGYVLAPGAALNDHQKTDRTDQSELHASPVGISSLGGDDAMLTFPEFLQFQQNTDDKKTQNKNNNNNNEEEQLENILDFPESKVENSNWNTHRSNYDYGRHAQFAPSYSPLAAQLLNEIRQEVKQLSEQRAAYVIQSQCGNVCEYYPTQGLPGFLLDTRMDPFPLSHGFNLRLRDQMIANPWTQIKLNNFYIPSGTGSFIRGFRLSNLLSSDVTVPLSGVYSLSLSLHFRLSVADLEHIRLKHNVVVSILATDYVYTERKPSSQYLSTIPQAKQFTVHFSTTLYLQAGTPLTVEVENASKVKVIIKEESEFSAHLIGA